MGDGLHNLFASLLTDVMQQPGFDAFLCILTVAGWLLLVSSRQTVTIPTIVLLVMVAFTTGQLVDRWQPFLSDMWWGGPHDNRDVSGRFEGDAQRATVGDTGHVNAQSSEFEESVNVKESDSSELYLSLARFVLGPYLKDKES
jgi:hypothetical protein